MVTSGRFTPVQWAAGGGLAFFAATIVAEHVVNSELSPRHHQISEYANGTAPWLMTTGFAAWAVSLAVTAALLQLGRTRLLAGAVAVAALGAALVTAFHTQAVAGQVPVSTPRTTQGRLHDLGGELLIAGLLGSALLVAIAMCSPRWLRRAAVATLAYFVVVTAGMLLFTSDTNGLRQRLVLLAAVAWQASLLAVTQPRHPVAPGRRPHMG